MVAQLNNLRSLVYQGIVSHVTNCTLEYKIFSILSMESCAFYSSLPAYSKVKTRVPYESSQIDGAVCTLAPL